MIEITNTQDVLDKIDIHKIPTIVLKDILLQTYLFDTQFPKEYSNKVIILNSNETYNMDNLIPELEQNLEYFHKTVYITSDSGEGIIIYKNTNTGEDNE